MHLSPASPNSLIPLEPPPQNDKCICHLGSFRHFVGEQLSNPTSGPTHSGSESSRGTRVSERSCPQAAARQRLPPIDPTAAARELKADR